MAEGRTNTAIGQRLFLSEKTVEGNVRRIFDKLGLTDTPEDNRRVLAVLAFHVRNAVQRAISPLPGAQNWAFCPPTPRRPGHRPVAQSRQAARYYYGAHPM